MPSIRLERPSALALGPRDALYIADDGRNQILKRSADGRYEVVAGDGTRGFSGDGGSAVKAKLNDPGGIAVAADGTLYFADTGNNRVRSISPMGSISTVAGDGRSGWVASGTRATAASVTSPEAVAIGPDRRLYIAQQGWSEILRLSSNGILTRIAGIRGPEGVHGVGGPAIRASADGPTGLAFDRSGNLYIAGSNTKDLLMITPEGTMRLPAGEHNFYPRGRGGLARGRDGTVVAMNGQRIVRLTPTGLRTIVDLSSRAPGGISTFAPNGLAVGRNGEIYADTWAGNGFTTATALIEIDRTGRVHVLWRS